MRRVNYLDLSGLSLMIWNVLPIDDEDFLAILTTNEAAKSTGVISTSQSTSGASSSSQQAFSIANVKSCLFQCAEIWSPDMLPVKGNI